MKNLKKITLGFIAFAICSQLSTHANDLINVLDTVMKNLSTNPPATRPKTVVQSVEYSPQSSTPAASSTSTTSSSVSTTPSTGDTRLATEKYRLLSKTLWDGAEMSFSKMHITALLSSQYDGIVSNFDTPAAEIKGRTVLPWYNDNYIVWNTEMGNDGIFYSQEFDKNKNEKTFIVLIQPNDTDKYFRIYEYVKNEQITAALTTAFIYDSASDEAFLFDSNANLLIAKYKDLVKVKNPEIVKNPDFMNQITAIFDKYNK